MISFDIPFNENITKYQYELSYRLMFNKSIRNIKRLLIMGLVFLVLGSICGYSDKEYFNPYTIISFIWIFIAFVIGIPFYLIMTKLKKSTKDLLDETSEKKLKAHYEFSDNGMKYTNGIISSEIQWTGIKGYSIVQDNIFIMLSKSILYSHIIGKKELSEENYELLLDLLEKRVEFKEYNI